MMSKTRKKREDHPDNPNERMYEYSVVIITKD